MWSMEKMFNPSLAYMMEQFHTLFRMFKTSAEGVQTSES